MLAAELTASLTRPSAALVAPSPGMALLAAPAAAPVPAETLPAAPLLLGVPEGAPPSALLAVEAAL
jgi:hypothetical protein